MSANRVDGVKESVVKGTADECRHVWALIDALAEEDPSPQALDAIGEHFAHCARCTDAEASLEEVLALYRSQDTVSIPAGLEKRLLDCLCGQDERDVRDDVRDEAAKHINKNISTGGNTK